MLPDAQRVREDAMSTPPRSAANAGKKESFNWADLLRAIVQVFWFGFAVIAFFWLYPLAEAALQAGRIDKIRIFQVEIELARVPLTRPDEEKAKLSVEAGADLISADNRERISARFGQMEKQIAGANILWVDDQHPQQNVRERRVLNAAGVNVDQAKSTDEAIQWLVRAAYDAVITDAYREKDPTAPCQSQEVNPSAGCDLLRKVGDCYQQKSLEMKPAGSMREFSNTMDAPQIHVNCVWMQTQSKGTPPLMIVYSGRYNPVYGKPPYAFGMTNRADDLFDLVLDALARRHVREQGALPARAPTGR
jgi:hypothetical protein